MCALQVSREQVKRAKKSSLSPPESDGGVVEGRVPLSSVPVSLQRNPPPALSQEGGPQPIARGGTSVPFLLRVAAAPVSTGAVQSAGDGERGGD